jgi:hypothetical protein
MVFAVLGHDDAIRGVVEPQGLRRPAEIAVIDAPDPP